MAKDMYAESCSVCVGMLGTTSIVEVAGEVDIGTVSLLVKALGDAMTSGKGDVILDAQKLTYIDSAGLQTLISVKQKLGASGRRMAIVGCHGIFYKLMQISKLDTLFSMFPSIDEAVACLESSSA